VHLIKPFIESVQTFDTRDQLFTSGVEAPQTTPSPTTSSSRSRAAKEGLTLGLAITVRYRLDPRRLDYIQARLPKP